MKKTIKLIPHENRLLSVHTNFTLPIHIHKYKNYYMILIIVCMTYIFIVVSCPPLHVSNGVVYVSSYNYNGFASVVCNDGFVYNGSYTPAFCLASGQWTDNQPQCINISQSSTGIYNGINCKIYCSNTWHW